jgi:filamentous hemagglutinin family protein
MLRPSFLSLALATLGLTSLTALAAPTGGSVVSGTASIRTNGVQTDIVQSSARAVIDWRQFNIGSGESVHFRQPDARSSTLNRVTGGDPSQILGTLTANGQVLLLNPNGVLFGRDARVDTAGLIVSTARLGAEDFMAGRLNFSAPQVPGGSVVNQGTITVREGGLAAFVAPHVRNEGLIQADLGRVMLASGSSFAVDLAGDGLISLALREADLDGLRDVQGRPVTALLENSGALVARSGAVVVMTPAMASAVIDQAIHLGGVVRADTVQRDGAGAILLSAGQGQVAMNGEIAAPGGSFTLRHDGDLLSLQGGSADALGRVLRTGTDVKVDVTGRLDVASRIDGRGGATGAQLSLSAASIGIRNDIYTQDGTFQARASAGAAEMLRSTTEILPGRSWPVIMTGAGDIRLTASGQLTASHLVTRGHVVLESTGGNVNVVSSLGQDLNGPSPLASLTVRALGQPDARDVGNVSELYDVRVAAGGRIDIAATRNIQIFATGALRPGLTAARTGVEGRSLRLVSDRLGTGDLSNNSFYWTGLNSRARHVGRGTSPVDAAGRWTSLQTTAKEAGNPTVGAPPGPTNVRAAVSADTGGLSVLAVPEAATLPDLLPGASTVVAAPAGQTDLAAPELATLVSAEEGFSANRGIAQLADTGRARSTSLPKDIFSLADHVVEVPACSSLSLGGASYFVRGAFGQTLNLSCR